MNKMLSLGPVVLFSVVLFLLLLRDVPYLNVVFINKLWVLYLVILLVVLFSRFKKKFALISGMVVLLFIFAFIFIVLQLSAFAETAGVIVYIALWALFIRRMMAL